MRTSNAVFLDRDGTLIRSFGRRPANSVEEVELLPMVVEGLQEIGDLNLRTVLVTNQGGVGLGFISESTVVQQHARMNELLRSARAPELTACYFCGHSPYALCSCRKPRPGMLQQAARELDIDLATSYIIGDGHTDIGAGVEAGVPHRILILGGWEEASPAATFTAKDMLDAVRIIRSIELGAVPVREYVG